MARRETKTGQGHPILRGDSRVRDERRIEESDGAVRALLEFMFLGGDHQSVQRVRALFEPTSLDELAKSLTSEWVAAGSKPATAWVVDALGVFGSAAIVPWVKAKVAERIRQRDKRGARTLLRQLIHIDSPSARLAVLHRPDLKPKLSSADGKRLKRVPAKASAEEKESWLVTLGR